VTALARPRSNCTVNYRPVLSSEILVKRLELFYNFACGSVWVRNLSLTLREEHRLRLFENRVLRRIFGPKRD
jgi:hypothetical protein